MKKRIVLFGASGGVGHPLARHLEKAGHELHCFSRTRVDTGEWTKLNLASIDELKGIEKKYRDTSFDALIYAAGTWEENAFTSDYSFLKSSLADNLNVLNINLSAPIVVARLFAGNLKKADGAKLIFFGALSGLDHFGSREVANTATKFGMIGAIQALHAELREHKISCTVINPGNIETQEVLEDIAAGRFTEQTAIPLDDIYKTIDYILNTSNRSAVTEINIEQLS